MVAPGMTVFDGSGNEYSVGKILGHGGFGFVYEIQRKQDNMVFALKTLPSDFASIEAYQSFINESQMAMKVSHSNTINYIYVHDGKELSNLPPYIIMEYANQGTLLDMINNQKNTGEFFTNELLKMYFSQLIDGMEHINSVVVHRDIKPDNILVHDGVLKVADFGLSKVSNEHTRQLTFKGIGHIKYMAPERWRQEKNTIQNDIYSMGIVFYELATLRHPYNVKNETDMRQWEDAHWSCQQKCSLKTHS
ncbi:serine/threonine-protein kinase [Paenibacillus athensensis]|uniref:Protein kinase domain-containing protein n=1 Tax=Paenibacillus athensensis TaxID=1967502 RepID=A0A4Y8PSJ9_9BACL|nr:serine/threonine-protein kinase [Paenibacillus athensensis]MCD1260570.1 serine/threonine-protein kinase [Paenibacillus athensensis]